MIRSFFEGMGIILVFTSPAYVLPILLGPLILRSYRADPLGGLAGAFTLKPLAATPLWALLLFLSDRMGLPDQLAPLVVLIPGIGLTLIIVRLYGQVFRSEKRIAFILLACDALRWLNTFFWSLLSGDLSAQTPFHIIGLVLPNAYAIMAIAILSYRARQDQKRVPVT
jgi:hypothetical protein